MGSEGTLAWRMWTRSNPVEADEKGSNVERSQGSQVDGYTTDQRCRRRRRRPPPRTSTTMRRYDATTRRRCRGSTFRLRLVKYRVPRGPSTARPSQSPARHPFGPVALLVVYRAMRQVNASFMPSSLALSASVPQTPDSPGTNGVTTACQIPPCPVLSCHRLHVTPCPCHHALTHL